MIEIQKRTFTPEKRVALEGFTGEIEEYFFLDATGKKWSQGFDVTTDEKENEKYRLMCVLLKLTRQSPLERFLH